VPHCGSHHLQGYASPCAPAQGLSAAAAACGPRRAAGGGEPGSVCGRAGLCVLAGGHPAREAAHYGTGRRLTCAWIHIGQGGKQEACLLSACTDDGLNAVGIRKGDFLVIEALPVHRLRTEKTAAVRVGEGLRARQFVRPCNTRFSCHLQTIATPR